MKKYLAGFFLLYLRLAAMLKIRNIKPVIIGVGGASGKTSLANFISLILNDKYKVRETEGKNSETGIPLSILGLSLKSYGLLDWARVFILAPIKLIFDWQRFDILVAEMGIDGPFAPNNMSYLLKILRPDVGVLTNISFEHSQNFDTLAKEADEDKRQEEILDLTASEENLLLEKVKKGGNAIINLDDKKIKENLQRVKANRVTVSLKDPTADFFAEKVSVDLNNFAVFFVHKNNKYKIEIKNPLPSHFATSFLLAIAASLVLGVHIQDAIKTLEDKFSLPSGRFNVFKGIKNTTILDSSYNSSLLPLIDSLDLLKRIAGKRRKVAILGDMRELGTMSQREHQEAAKKILETSDAAILVGPLMQKFVSPVLAKNNHEFYSFLNFSKARNFIKKTIKSGDLILVKGSQNTLYLEQAVEMLLENKSDAKKLCRRGSFWDKQRRKNN